MTNDHDRPPTPDERRAMDWWNALTDQERRDLMKNADTRISNPSAAEAWNLLLAGEISGPPLPPGAKPIALPPGDEWRRRKPTNDDHDDDYSDEGYARRAAAIDRRIGSAAPWSPLVRGSDGGGFRDFLDGRPVTHGSLLELQAFDYVKDPADPTEERRRRLDRGILVSYETEVRASGRQVVLYLRTGGHTFTTDADPSMRFRWPPRDEP